MCVLNKTPVTQINFSEPKNESWFKQFNYRIFYSNKAFLEDQNESYIYSDTLLDFNSF